ncbi:MAG: cell division protein FtsK, partial [Acidobacteria bacterium]
AAWAHFLETRRREKMRREVIKKHSLKEKDAPGSDSLPRFRKVKAAPAGEGEELADLPLRASPANAPAQRPLPFSAPEPELKEEEEESAEPKESKRKKAPAPTVRGNYVLPPASILDEARSSGTLDKARLFEKAKTLQAKSGEFGVMGNVVEIHPGPVVTTYEFKPDAGVKYSKIVGLADDLALALEAESIRIDRSETIYLREIMESETFRGSTSRLTLGLGKTVSGDTYVTDLTAMPHLLIAGSTGTGKSVGLNCMIASILLRATPDEVRLILIDPKRLELGVYEDIPHLLTPVVTDAKIASNVLKWAVGEMERRIRRLASEGVRNIEQFNNLVRAEGGDRTTTNGNGEDEELKPLHYIVIVID